MDWSLQPRPSIPTRRDRASPTTVALCPPDASASRSALAGDGAGFFERQVFLGHPVGEPGDDAQIVGDQDQRHVELALQIGQQMEDGGST